MMDSEKISRDEFLKLPTDYVMRWVVRNNTPHTGIFIADGNRRLVMTQTDLNPTSEDFYRAYLDIVPELFKKNLAIFFSHGLYTLLFPLFGTSLLGRCSNYRQIVMPGLVRLLFQSEKWLSFYGENDIRVKSYGDTEILEREFPGLDLVNIIRHAEEQTSSNGPRTLFYGFFSNVLPDMTHIREAHRLMDMHNRDLTQEEWSELYYGEPVPTADFFITSTAMGYLGALPPMLYGKNTRMYTLPVPGIIGLNERTYREILYDLLFLRQATSTKKLESIKAEDIACLKNLFGEKQNKVVGAGKMIGEYWLLDV